jgi:RHS repeat-associated protein
MQATYDGLGRCVRRTTPSGTLVFTYDGWKPILEWDGAGNWTATNVYGAGADEILARQDSSGRMLIYKQDRHGNVVAVLTDNGDVTEKYSYDAFGKPSIFDKWGNGRAATAIGNRFMFQGREWISELGIYDFRHRMYQPELGRFLQTDPTGFDAGDMNLFRYVADDPVDGSDPTGLFDIWGNLHNFFTGNPSMNVVLDAWNNRPNSGLTMAPLGRTDASPNLRHYSDWRDAADSRREETMNLVQGDHIEYGGELAQRDDNSTNYVATAPHAGLGVKRVDDGVEQGYRGFSQAFSPDKTRVPRGYHMTGFYYGHVYHDPRKFHYDAIRAQKHGLDAVLFLPARAHAISKRPISLYYDHNTIPPE